MKKISRSTAAVAAADSSFLSSTGGVASSPIRGGNREMSFEETTIPSQYPRRLSLYLSAPDYEISIDDFEELALSRLEILKAVETAGIRNLRDDDLSTWIRKYEQKHLPLHGNNVASRFPLFDERRRDEASNYILRLAFCGAVPNEVLASSTDGNALNSAEDARRWFITQETSLLRYRLQMSMENRAERDEFISHCLRVLSQSSDAIRPLRAEDKTAALDDLKALHGADVVHEEFIDCAWELVPDLVGRRGVLIRRGRAYVPRSDCASIILNRFKEELEASLELIAREVPFLRDDRLVPLLDALRRCDYSLDAAMTGGSASSIVGQLAAADVDKASVHMPLCMQNLHRNLRADRHLKFGGRQQYGLFLKSIGLPLSEALVFWRTAFLPKYSVDQFNKDYAYNVRHNYGQEGKRANYASYSCGKICSGSGGNGEYHGCPFKHSQSVDRLSNVLALYTGPNGVKLTAPQIKEVASLAIEGSHYQLACTRVFEMTRPKTGNSPVETITYPHKYYENPYSLKAEMYRDDDFVLDNFSQLLNQTEEQEQEQQQQQVQEKQQLYSIKEEETPLNEKIKKRALSPEEAKGLLEEFEEAYSVIKSIEKAHEPISYTSMTAFLYHQRAGFKVNKRTVDGFLWPEHAQSLSDSKLISKPFNNNTQKMIPSHEKIPKFLVLNESNSEEDDLNVLEDSAEESSIEEAPSTLKLSKFSNSIELHSSLKRAAQSIWEKLKRQSHPHDDLLDPRMKHILARRTARLLQAVFNRTIRLRKAALAALRLKIPANEGDVDNVPINWESVQEAAKQLIGQEGLDQGTYDTFKDRIEETFIN